MKVNKFRYFLIIMDYTTVRNIIYDWTSSLGIWDSVPDILWNFKYILGES